MKLYDLIRYAKSNLNVTKEQEEEIEELEAACFYQLFNDLDELLIMRKNDFSEITEGMKSIKRKYGMEENEDETL